MNQNVVVRTGDLGVVNSFGANVNSQPESRKKSKAEEKKFVVGETVVGGEETV